MKKDITSKFQMQDCFVREVILHKPVILEPPFELSTSYHGDIVYGLRVEDNSSRYAVISLSLRLMQGTDLEADVSSNEIFSVRIFAQSGFIAPVSYVDEKKFLEMVKTTGAASMIPIMRAYVTGVLAICGIPSDIRIPNIDVTALEWEITRFQNAPADGYTHER